MREPLYRETFDAAALLQEHPPRLHDSHKLFLFRHAYPEGAVPAGLIEVTRWPAEVPDSLKLPEQLLGEVRPDYYDYSPMPAAHAALEWHVNFADPQLFGAYGSSLFAQDEMQVVEHPLLGCIREALLARRLAARTMDQGNPTPILVRNVERRISVATNADAAMDRPHGLYGNRFADAPLSTVRQATRRIEPATFSNIIAMAAPSDGYGEYSENQIALVLTTALTAFDAAVRESIRSHGVDTETIVHSGFWGCGAFGGNRTIMIALQALAARAANVSRLIIHAGDASGVTEAQRALGIAENLVARSGSSSSFNDIVQRCAELRCQWGESDGN